MPKIGMEAVRKEALVKAAIAEVGATGSTAVTVAGIARRAGVSPALAHHYFGSKDAIFLAAMRSILDDFGRLVRDRYDVSEHPRDRLHAIIDACFEPSQFDPAIVSAWLAFYVLAHRSAEAARLLTVYQRRLDSNLVFALEELVPKPDARRLASGIAAMIDGYYIRAALHGFPVDRKEAAGMVSDYVDLNLSTLAKAEGTTAA
ncbi:transcriptional regulator BetI [Amorphus orientalis]|uniref:HTH-type transcriptional regulator BetI n=1 Tax=Amorphus orientalis TaxID=649198 RepID=A0AAE3VNP7_9HYPH|nr:transcriptional regulator BetI [Amorphus orientalis]MDQ0315407.1 TetR/AcrR family transcriptional repressor of bet genes [Amorphus orientalis]